MDTRIASLRCAKVAVFGVGLAMSSLTALAHTLPEGSDLDSLEAATDASERITRMNRLETHRIGAGLQEKAVFKLNEAQLEASGLSPSERALALNRGPFRAFPYAAQPELRSVGTVNTLTVLIDFSEHRAETVLPGMTADRISENIYGDGTEDARAFFPFESVHNYYQRASEGKLDLTGEVHGWIHLPKVRSSYEPVYPSGASPQKRSQIDNQALFDLIREALELIDEDTDFSRYDNDHDGDIDLVTVMYAGPDTGWGGFWWAYRWQFFISDAFSAKFDNKRLNQFVFQFVDQRPEQDFDPTTLIHETGHALGLPDYYDYCSSRRFEAGHCSPAVTNPGPDGGVGGLDIMDANRGNHNAFSRWLLDWIEALVVEPGEPESVELTAAGEQRSGIKAVSIYPGLQPTNAPGQELFVVENRSQVGNDGGHAQMPGDGLLIWHVNAKPNSNNKDFDHDNSYSDQKLVRLVRRQSAGDFSDGERANAEDYFGPGDEFTPTSVPSSAGFDGRPTGVSISEIKDTGEALAAKFGLIEIEPLVAGLPESVTPVGSEDYSVMSSRVGRVMALPPVAAVDPSRLEKFNADFQLAAPEDLASLWEEHRTSIDPEAAPTEATILAELLMSHWAAKDGKAAVEALLRLPDSAFTGRVFPQVMEAWVTNDPKGADEWYFAPEQEGIRSSDRLQAGERFAEVLFRWRGASTPDIAASAVDLLTGAPEIYGAVKGLNDAAAVAGADPTVIGSQLEALNIRSEEARALSDVRRALENASEQFQGRESRSEADKFLLERLRLQGLRER
jgi:M6 family metalloprotease-like protein